MSWTILLSRPWQHQASSDSRHASRCHRAPAGWPASHQLCVSHHRCSWCTRHGRQAVIRPHRSARCPSCPRNSHIPNCDSGRRYSFPTPIVTLAGSFGTVVPGDPGHAAATDAAGEHQHHNGVLRRPADDEVADDLWKKFGAGDTLCDTPVRSAFSPTGEDDGSAPLENTS